MWTSTNYLETEKNLWHDTTWNYWPTLRKEKIYNDIKNLNLKLTGKKLLCIAGGIGRNANALSKLGCDVTNSDIEESYITLGRKYYPNIKHIIYDMNTQPLSNYDYVLFEDCWNRPFNLDAFTIMNKWKNYTTVLPSQANLKIFKFNSDMIDNCYLQEEDIGNLYIKKQLSSGNIFARIYLSDIQDLETEDISIDILNLNIKIPKSEKHNYQLLGAHELGWKNRISGIFINNGLNIYIDDEYKFIRT
jgi:hypothetical protein